VHIMMNIVSFIGLFCKRDLHAHKNIMMCSLTIRMHWIARAHVMCSTRVRAHATCSIRVRWIACAHMMCSSIIPMRLIACACIMCSVTIRMRSIARARMMCSIRVHAYTYAVCGSYSPGSGESYVDAERMMMDFMRMCYKSYMII